MPASPADVLLVILVSRIEDHLQKFLVPRRAANILGWTTPFASEADRRFDNCVGWGDFLQNNFVVPVVAEVINVGDRVAFGPEHLRELSSALVDQVEFVKLIPLWDAPILAVLLPLVEMAVRSTPSRSEWPCGDNTVSWKREPGRAARSAAEFRPR